MSWDRAKGESKWSRTAESVRPRAAATPGKETLTSDLPSFFGELEGPAPSPPGEAPTAQAAASSTSTSGGGPDPKKLGAITPRLTTTFKPRTDPGKLGVGEEFTVEGIGTKPLSAADEQGMRWVVSSGAVRRQPESAAGSSGARAGFKVLETPGALTLALEIFKGPHAGHQLAHVTVEVVKPSKMHYEKVSGPEHWRTGGYYSIEITATAFVRSDEVSFQGARFLEEEVNVTYEGTLGMHWPVGGHHPSKQPLPPSSSGRLEIDRIGFSGEAPVGFLRNFCYGAAMFQIPVKYGVDAIPTHPVEVVTQRMTLDRNGHLTVCKGDSGLFELDTTDDDLK
jgi:hypothetical protein